MRSITATVSPLPQESAVGMTRAVLTVTVVVAGIVSAAHVVTGARAPMGVTEGANKHRSSSLRDFSMYELCAL